VLIPRPDTEVLVEEVLRQEQGEKRVFLDMGTGSGAIAAALLRARPGWQALASDLSPAALCTARTNLPPACLCLCADRLEGLAGPLDFVVCNPPYVTRREFARLPRSVRAFEPAMALDGGEDGLDFYRYLAAHSAARLRSGGALFLEIGWRQARRVTGLLRRAGWREVKLRRDLAGRPRVVSARCAA
jgi:release factor glutamine methyltransferase